MLRRIAFAALVLLTALPGCGSMTNPTKTIASSAKPVTLTAEPVRVTLKLRGGRVAQALRDGRRFYVVLSGLRAARQPGVPFHVYLDLPPGTAPDKRAEHQIGTFTFYNAAGGGTGSEDESFSFDITDAARMLRGRDTMTLTFAPAARRAPAGKPAVGRIDIVAE